MLAWLAIKTGRSSLPVGWSEYGCFNELGDDLIRESLVLCSPIMCLTVWESAGLPQPTTRMAAYRDMVLRRPPCRVVDGYDGEKIGMDPFEIRWRNIARPGDLNINQHPFVNYPMEKIMETMKPIYERAVAEAKAANEKNDPKKRRGVGLAWGGYNVTEGTADQCTVALELREDGKMLVRHLAGSGTGRRRRFSPCNVGSQTSGVTIDDIVLIQNDSKHCPDSGASASSRSHYMNGKATKMAADMLINAMRKPDGTFRTYEEMVAEGIPTKYEAQYENPSDPDLRDLDPNTVKGNPTPDYTYASSSPDRCGYGNSKVTVVRYTCVDDVGVIGDLASVNGQAYGGISHSIGFALQREHDDVKNTTISQEQEFRRLRIFRRNRGHSP